MPKALIAMESTHATGLCTKQASSSALQATLCSSCSMHWWLIASSKYSREQAWTDEYVKQLVLALLLVGLVAGGATVRANSPGSSGRKRDHSQCYLIEIEAVVATVSVCRSVTLHAGQGNTGCSPLGAHGRSCYSWHPQPSGFRCQREHPYRVARLRLWLELVYWKFVAS